MATIRGHGAIVNMSSGSSFVFQYNPEKMDTEKKINYAVSPNIGGAYKKRYFSGFEAEEINFKIMCVDMDSPFGVTEEIAFFKQLREPDPGMTGGWGLDYGNVNFPPPQVLFQWGISLVPLVWDVLDIKINEDHFHADLVRGIMGIAKKCEVEISLALDEGHALNKMNQIAKKAMAYAATAKSAYREYAHLALGKRKERGMLLNFNNDSRTFRGTTNSFRG